MATVSYPKIPESNWWRLRDQFKKTLPNAVTTAYLRSLLALNTEGAAQNLIGPLRQVGLIDEGGKPTARANDWRNDAKYAEVCAAMLLEVYPQELRDLYSGRDLDRGAVEKWFMHGAALGEAAASRNAQFYVLLNDAVPQSADSAPRKSDAAKKSGSTSKARAPKASSRDTRGSASAGSLAEKSGDAQRTGGTSGPTVHMDFQIHISPDAGPEQIEAIFAAMAKHLYTK